MMELTNEMSVELMNVVREKMENGESFTKKSIFDAVKEQYVDEWENVCYCSVKKEIAFLINEVMDEIGGYAAKFEEDYDGKIVYTFSPTAEEDYDDDDYDDEDDDDSDDEEDDDDDSDDEEDDDDSDDEDEDDDDYDDEDDEDDDDDYDDEDLLDEYSVIVGNKNRVYITKEMFDKANISSDEVCTLSVDNTIEITEAGDDGMCGAEYRYKSNTGGLQIGVKKTLSVSEGDYAQIKIYDGKIVIC